MMMMMMMVQPSTSYYRVDIILYNRKPIPDGNIEIGVECVFFGRGNETDSWTTIAKSATTYEPNCDEIRDSDANGTCNSFSLIQGMSASMVMMMVMIRV